MKSDEDRHRAPSLDGEWQSQAVRLRPFTTTQYGLDLPSVKAPRRRPPNPRWHGCRRAGRAAPRRAITSATTQRRGAGSLSLASAAQFCAEEPFASQAMAFSSSGSLAAWPSPRTQAPSAFRFTFAAVVAACFRSLAC